jgi:RNA recognition motif-containing protein
MDVGANLFIGNLDPDVDEKMLQDTFASFGNLLSSKVRTIVFYDKILYAIIVERT